MKPIFCCLALALACACSKDGTDSYAAKPSGTTTTASKPASSAPVATDTSSDKADVDLLARVRKVIVDDSTMSTAGKNITIVVRAGSVSLSGDVPTAAERARIENLATGVAGVNHVDNHIEVKP